MMKFLMCVALVIGLYGCGDGECSDDADCAAGYTCVTVGLGEKGGESEGSTSTCNDCPPISDCERQPEVGCPVFDPEMIGQACEGREDSNFETPGPGICRCAGECTEGSRMYCNP